MSLHPSAFALNQAGDSGESASLAAYKERARHLSSITKTGNFYSKMLMDISRFRSPALAKTARCCTSSSEGNHVGRPFQALSLFLYFEKTILFSDLT